MKAEEQEAIELAMETLKKYHYYVIDKGITDNELLNKSFTAFHALKSALAEEVVLNHSWTKTEKDNIDYVLIGHINLPGIEDMEYPTPEVDLFDNVLEAVQEKFITGSNNKKAPLVVYVGGLSNVTL